MFGRKGNKIETREEAKKEKTLDKTGEVKEEIEEVGVLKENTLNMAQYIDENFANFKNLIISIINAALVIVAFCFIVLLGIVVIKLTKYVKNSKLHFRNSFRAGLMEVNNL